MSVQERWLPVVGYEGFYEVSDLGRVRSLDRILDDGRVRRSKTLRATMKKDTGRLKVSLSRNGVVQTALVHRLVAVAFLGAPPDGRGLVLHGDGNHLNNRAENLRWGTYVDNVQDSIKHGTHRNQYSTAAEVLGLRTELEALAARVTVLEDARERSAS